MNPALERLCWKLFPNGIRADTKDATPENVIAFPIPVRQWAGCILLAPAAAAAPDFYKRDDVEIPGVPGKMRLTVKREGEQKTEAFVTLTAHRNCTSLLGKEFVLRLKGVELGRAKFCNELGALVATITLRRPRREHPDDLMEMTIEPATP